MTTIDESAKTDHNARNILLGFVVLLAILAVGILAPILMRDGAPKWAAQPEEVTNLSQSQLEMVHFMAQEDMYWVNVTDPLTLEEKDRVVLGVIHGLCHDDYRGLNYMSPEADDKPTDYSITAVFTMTVAMGEFC